MVGVLMSAALAMAPMVQEAPSCAEQVGASASTRRLSDLPGEIRTDLAAFGRAEIGDSDGPLLNTDAPSAEERNYPVLRFYQALRVGERWFVQIEVANFADVRTLVYRYRAAERVFSREPWQYYSGPACASIKASLAGVMTPPQQ